MELGFLVFLTLISLLQLVSRGGRAGETFLHFQDQNNLNKNTDASFIVSFGVEGGAGNGLV